MFFIAAVIYVLCGTFYVIFGSGERQAWDDPSTDEEKAARKKKKKAEKNGEVLNGTLVEETRQ